MAAGRAEDVQLPRAWVIDVEQAAGHHRAGSRDWVTPEGAQPVTPQHVGTGLMLAAHEQIGLSGVLPDRGRGVDGNPARRLSVLELATQVVTGATAHRAQMAESQQGEHTSLSSLHREPSRQERRSRASEV